MSTISQKTSFEAVQTIAKYCAEIDDAWHQSVKDLTDEMEQAKAVAKCTHKLDQMSQQVTRCSVIVFRKIKLTEGESRSYLEIRHKESAGGRRPSLCLRPLDTKTTEFHLLHGGTIWPIQLDPDSNHMLVLDTPVPSSPTELTWDKVNGLASKMWDGCLVATSNSTLEVIPIPR